MIALFIELYTKTRRYTYLRGGVKVELAPPLICHFILHIKMHNYNPHASLNRWSPSKAKRFESLTKMMYYTCCLQDAAENQCYADAAILSKDNISIQCPISLPVYRTEINIEH